jgi:hypothetical protein
MHRSQLSVPVIMCLASLYGAGCGGGEVVVHGPPPPRAEVVVAAPQVRTEVVAPAQVAVVAATPQVSVLEAAPAEVVVKTKPPVERVEVIPVAPSPAHVWIKGHWHWNGGEWVWNPGRYEVAKPGLHWVPAQYVERGGAFYYVGGHWGR